MNLRRIIQTVVDSAWLAALYFGLFQGVVGALNVALFFTWVICVMSLLCFTKEVAMAVGKKSGAVMAWSTGFDIAAILMLAWSGWFGTAAFLTGAVIIIVGSWCQERANSEPAV